MLGAFGLQAQGQLAGSGPGSSGSFVLAVQSATSHSVLHLGHLCDSTAAPARLAAGV